MRHKSIQKSPVVTAQAVAKMPSMHNGSAAWADGSLMHPHRWRQLHQALPAAGNRSGTSISNVGSNGNYWSRTLNSSNPNNAYNLNFNSGNWSNWNNNNRNNGFTVRAVRVSQHLSCRLMGGVHPFLQCN